MLFNETFLKRVKNIFKWRINSNKIFKKVSKTLYLFLIENKSKMCQIGCWEVLLSRAGKVSDSTLRSCLKQAVDSFETFSKYFENISPNTSKLEVSENVLEMCWKHFAKTSATLVRFIFKTFWNELRMLIGKRIKTFWKWVGDIPHQSVIFINNWKYI